MYHYYPGHHLSGLKVSDKALGEASGDDRESPVSLSLRHPSRLWADDLLERPEGGLLIYCQQHEGHPEDQITPKGAGSTPRSQPHGL